MEELFLSVNATFEFFIANSTIPPSLSPHVNLSSLSLHASLSLSPYTPLTMVLTAIPIIFIIIVIVFGNALVIVAVLSQERLKRKTQNWLIASLAFADLAVGLLIMPFTLSYELLSRWTFGNEFCEIWLASDVLFVTASILNLCAISIDRFCSLTDPIHYSATISSSKARLRICIMIACPWILALAICLPPLVGWRPEHGVGDAGVGDPSPGDPKYGHPNVGDPNYGGPTYGAGAPNIELRDPNISDSKYGDPNIGSPNLGDPNQGLGKPDGQFMLGGSCNLSGDVGYVLYSALGSFFFPLTIVVFIYVKIFLLTRRRMKQQRRKAKQRQNLLKSEEANKSTWTTQLSIARPIRENGPIATTPIQIRREKLTAITCDTSFENSTIYEAPRKNDDLNICAPSFLLKPLELKVKIMDQRKGIRKRERQATLVLGLILGAFVLSWMPFFVSYVLSAVCCQTPEIIFDIIFWLGYCNSGLNPFIYNFFNPDFRRAFRRILFRRV